MSRILWLGHAPDVPQIDLVEFDEGQVVAEGSKLLFTINGKTIEAENPTEVEDLTPGTDTAGDTGGVLSILQVAEAAINGSTIPEFQELTAAVESPDESTENPYHRLRLTGPDGVPFTLAVTAPIPTVDVDVQQEGGPGQNEIQEFYFTPAPTGGTFQVVWNLGSGLEFSAPIDAGADAADVESAIIAGMASVMDGDVEVTGGGTVSNPYRVELMGNLEETNVTPLQVGINNLTGNGIVTITTVQDGASGDSDAAFTFLDLAAGDPKFTGGGPFNFEGIAINQAAMDAAIGAGNCVVTIGSQNWVAIKFTGDWADIPVFCYITGVATYTQGPGNPGGAGTQNEIVVIENDHTSGNFTITVDDGGGPQTTGNIAYNANAAAVISALEALSNVDPGDVDVVALTGSQAWAIEFSGSLTNTNLTVTVSDVDLAGGTYLAIDTILDGAAPTAINEIQSLYTNGSGGTFTITKPGGSTSSALSPLSTTAQIKAAVEAIYGGTETVTGSGTAGDPWLITFAGALAGVNQSQMTGSGTNLTGGFTATISTEQDGSGPLPTIWIVYLSGATGGTYTYEFKGRLTSALAYNANAATVEAALVALEPGTFTGLFDVTGSGSLADPFLITAQGILAGEPQLLATHNDNLTGVGQTLNHTTYQEATGKFFIDNEANYRNVDTGATGLLPVTGDELYVQQGGSDNSMKYGSLSGVKLRRFIQSQMFDGDIGLPFINPAGYIEYRPTFIELEFGAYGYTIDDPNIVIGVEQGPGSGLTRLQTITGDDVHIRVERTGGPSESGFGAFCWQVEDVGTDTPVNTVRVIEGSVGIAQFAWTAARMYAVEQYGGTLQFGELAQIGAGGFKRFGGEVGGRAQTTEGTPIIFGP